MTRRRLLGFLHRPTGEWRELIDPDGEATGPQLLRLNREGRLALVELHAAEPLTKGEAAYAIDVANEAAR